MYSAFTNGLCCNVIQEKKIKIFLLPVRDLIIKGKDAQARRDLVLSSGKKKRKFVNAADSRCRKF